MGGAPPHGGGLPALPSRRAPRLPPRRRARGPRAGRQARQPGGPPGPRGRLALARVGGRGPPLVEHAAPPAAPGGGAPGQHAGEEFDEMDVVGGNGRWRQRRALSERRRWEVEEQLRAGRDAQRALERRSVRAEKEQLWRAQQETRSAAAPRRPSAAGGSWRSRRTAGGRATRRRRSGARSRRAGGAAEVDPAPVPGLRLLGRVPGLTATAGAATSACSW
ncbi:unnamed protein product [Prorocentrum cordatum]|uniref:Uncharacterized protein n=1 Tax=Prorocentrum cordatum TaxID=2364126 RepID=A0ABN9TVM8_9DINO|nr:unnamed protein product [Polarella glacialis]